MIKEQASGNRLVGKYRGTVLKHLPHGRCKIYIPGVYSEEFLRDPDLLPSAEQATMMFAGTNEGNGVFTYPNLSSIVWCEFANGDVNFPIYSLATLGGEDAFGQYDLIKTKDEPICTRHMITSGKTHIMWYESGKISCIVEDPIRTQCSVDYDQFELESDNTSVDNKYSWSLSNVLRDKVHRKEISSIDCQIVLDNDADVHGELSASTHWYDVINDNDLDRQYKARGSNANDSYFLMNNDGLNELKTVSAYNVQENDGSSGKNSKTKNRIVHRIKTDNRGFYNQWSDVTKKINSVSPDAFIKKDEEYSYTIDYQDQAYAAIDTFHQLTSNTSENGQTQSGTTLHENRQVLGHEMQSWKDINIISADSNTKSSYANVSTISTDFLTDIDKGECRLVLLSSINLTDNNPSLGRQNVFITKLTNDLDMTDSGVITLQTKVNDVRKTANGTTDKKSEGTLLHNIDGLYKRQTKYKCLTNSFGTTTDVDNYNIETIENKTDAKHSLQLKSVKNANGSPVVDAKYSKIINLTTSTANIELVDNIAKKECVNNVDVKQGLLELRIKNKTSGMYCQILLDAEGKMTINTTSDINVTTPTQMMVSAPIVLVDAKSSVTLTTPQTTITGNVTIGGNLEVSGGETVGSDSVIGGKSFLGHMHIGNLGAPTSPPI